MCQSKLDKAMALLRRVNGFHISRISFLKELDKTKLNDYNETIVAIYEFLQDKEEEKGTDIYGTKLP